MTTWARSNSKSSARPSILRLLSLLRPKHKKYILGLIGRVLLSSTERLVIAYFTRQFIDTTLSKDQPGFVHTMISMVVFYLSYTVIAPFVINVWRSAIIEGTANIREVVFRHLQRLPLSYHEGHHSGDALSILTNDLSAAEKAYQDDLYILVEASVQGLSAAVYMLVLNWELALIIFVAGVAPLVINTLFAPTLRRIGQAVQANLSGLSERMTDLLAGYQVIRAFSLGEWILNRFKLANRVVLGSSLSRVRVESNLAAANEIGGILNFLSILIGAYLVLTGHTTFGVLVALIQLSNNTNYFVYSLGGVISRLQAALAAADRILALLDTPLEPERYPALPQAEAELPATSMSAAQPASEPAAAGDELIVFDRVVFGYAADPDILHALCFSVGRGEVVAFAGSSGGGKSTLFKLLMGAYPVRQGQIRVADRPLSDYPLSELRDLFAYVPQDAYLFATTISDNIRYGRPSASQAEIEAAATAAFAHVFIKDFPHGYQTLLGERGARVSGGQRQRIAIARALLKDAPILLLDEATSALDSESEQVVQQALQVLMKDRTTLVIAHRLSTILSANRIYVLDQGSVAEQGTHANLLEQKGIYAGLFELQFKT
jgi:ATP-binding cassette, subfamily B, bacterial